jgi:hypothetical protein
VAAGVLLVAAVVVLWTLAATYQPVQFGEMSGGVSPGMPAGSGLRTVNNFGVPPGEIYVPPQRGAFTVGESIVNTGPEPVTIEAVSMVAPETSSSAGNAPSPFIPAYPLVPAGPVKWYLPYSGPVLRVDLPAGCSYAEPCPLRGLTLPPINAAIVVEMQVRFSSDCYTKGAFAEDTDFYVEEKFGPFTHWVAVPLPIPYLFPSPIGQGQTAHSSGVACAGG